MKRRGTICKPLVLLTLLSAYLLIGCGGSSSQQSNTTGDQQTAEESVEKEVSAQEAEDALSAGGVTTNDGGDAIDEEPSLTNEDVAGIYLTDGAKDSAFTVYQLKKDGTYVYRIVVGEDSIEREGSYEISDGKVYVSAPEVESSFELWGTAYKAKELKNQEVVVEDGVYTTKDDGTTAHKISEDEYKQLVDKAAALGPKRISVGEPVSGDGYTFTVNSFEFKDEIYPSDTSGYYTYWQHEDDRDYLVADVTYVNDGTDYQAPTSASAALFNVGENKYNATIEVDGGSRTSSSYTIDAKDTGRVIVFASVPDAAREEGAEVKLTWLFPYDGSRMNYYYSSDYATVCYILTM